MSSFSHPRPEVDQAKENKGRVTSDFSHSSGEWEDPLHTLTADSTCRGQKRSVLSVSWRKSRPGQARTETDTKSRLIDADAWAGKGSRPARHRNQVTNKTRQQQGDGLSRRTLYIAPALSLSLLGPAPPPRLLVGALHAGCPS